MPKMTVLLERDEERALQRLALRERRDPPQQLAYLLRLWLEDNHLLPNATETGPATCKGVQRETA